MFKLENDVIITADELIKANLDSPEAIVENLLYTGFSILAGDPKVGKSWFASNLAIAVVNKQNFLNLKSSGDECLYYTLEDSYFRLRNRLTKIIGEEQLSLRGLHLANSCKSLQEGFLSDLEQILKQNTNIKIVIIDTLQLIRGTSKSSYANDYEQINELKKFADTHKICILAIHHLKRSKEKNKFNRILGGNGINGAVDTMIILEKLENSSNKALLSVTGRDVESNEKMLEFDKKNGKWKLIANNINANETIRKIAYANDSVAITIKKLLEKNTAGIRLTSTELIEEIIKETGTHPAQANAQALGRYIRDELQFQLLEYDNIHYSPPPINGGASGRRMYFYKQQNTETKEESENLDETKENIDITENTKE